MQECIFFISLFFLYLKGAVLGPGEFFEGLSLGGRQFFEGTVGKLDLDTLSCFHGTDQFHQIHL